MQVYLRLEKPAVPCVVDTGKEKEEGRCQHPDAGGMGREFHGSDRRKDTESEAI